MRTVAQWYRDQTTKDPDFTGTPQKHMDEFEDSMATLTPKRRVEEFNRRVAYADWYYKQHHGMVTVDPGFAERARDMQAQVKRLNEAERATERLYEIGGAPTSFTLQHAVSESKKEREQIRERRLEQNLDLPNRGMEMPYPGESIERDTRRSQEPAGFGMGQ